MTSSDLVAQVGKVLRRAGAGHAGMVVAVRRGHETGFWHRGDLPDGASTIFEIGSITKTFTTLALADMAREGLVSLDDPVQRHLPDHVRMPVRGREITLEDLATHRSGLPRLPKGLLISALTTDRHDPYARLDEARLERDIARTQPKREPGGKLVYSNYAVGVLGYALARRAGTTYEQLVRRRICEPLGLEDTWIDVPAGKQARLATGHKRRGRPTPPWNLAALAGAGGLRSTASDLLAYLRLHAPSASGPLAEAAAETARTRVEWRKIEMGLGWMVVPAGQRTPLRRTRHPMLLHEGGTGGFRAFAGAIPELDVAAVVLSNQARGVGGVGLRLLATLSART
jgi:CubicO group peptidase (beta-lactamase class C family)